MTVVKSTDSHEANEKTGFRGGRVDFRARLSFDESMSLGNILIFAMLLGLIPAFIARHRGGPFVFFWIIGTLLFPLGLLMSLLAKDGRRRCPFCAETVQKQASVCPHCQREIFPSAAAPAA